MAHTVLYTVSPIVRSRAADWNWTPPHKSPSELQKMREEDEREGELLVLWLSLAPEQ